MDKSGELSKTSGARDAIMAAFRDIVLEGGFDTMRVGDLAKRAGVARSTFYEHFQSRDDVLRESMRVPLRPLASLAAKPGGADRAVAVLVHFRQANRLAVTVLNAEGGTLVRDLLAEMIDGGTPQAYAIAGAWLSVIAAWLAGKDKRDPDKVASTLTWIGRALRGPASRR